MKRWRLFLATGVAVACAHDMIAPPVLKPLGFHCNPSDSAALKMVSGTEGVTTYWYDSLNAVTVQGIAGHGCLAGFKVNGA